MRTLRLGIATLVAAAVLTGCSDDEPDPGDSMSTWTPSGTVERPSSSAPPERPTEPPLPDAATKATEDGARAFITYYWDLVNYAQLTGDVKALKAVSAPGCSGCQAGIEAIGDVFGQGGHTEGGAYRLERLTLSEVKAPGLDDYVFTSMATVTNDEQVIERGNGTGSTSAPATNKFALVIEWDSTNWRIQQSEIR